MRAIFEWFTKLSVLEIMQINLERFVNNQSTPQASMKVTAVSSEAVLPSTPFHESITFTLKNFHPNVPFGFLNTFYLFSSNSKNLTKYNVSFPVIILEAPISR